VSSFARRPPEGAQEEPIRKYHGKSGIKWRIRNEDKTEHDTTTRRLLSKSKPYGNVPHSLIKKRKKKGIRRESSRLCELPNAISNVQLIIFHWDHNPREDMAMRSHKNPSSFM
jgi:hypothetical protein